MVFGESFERISSLREVEDGGPRNRSDEESHLELALRINGEPISGPSRREGTRITEWTHSECKYFI